MWSGVRSGFGVILAALAAMSGVSRDASTNLSWWFNENGFSGVALWLNDHSHLIASRLIWLLGLVAALCFFWPLIEHVCRAAVGRSETVLLADVLRQCEDRVYRRHSNYVPSSDNLKKSFFYMIAVLADGDKLKLYGRPQYGERVTRIPNYVFSEPTLSSDFSSITSVKGTKYLEIRLTHRGALRATREAEKLVAADNFAFLRHEKGIGRTARS